MVFAIFLIIYLYGFDNAGKIRLYLPEKKIDQLPEDFINWVNGVYFAYFDPTVTDVLNFYGFYNGNGKQGFSGGKVY